MGALRFHCIPIHAGVPCVLPLHAGIPRVVIYHSGSNFTTSTKKRITFSQKAISAPHTNSPKAFTRVRTTHTRTYVLIYRSTEFTYFLYTHTHTHNLRGFAQRQDTKVESVKSVNRTHSSARLFLLRKRRRPPFTETAP
jgi:hypothetical protein